MFKKILAAVDGSDDSLRALDAAAELARTQGARLVVTSVAYLPEAYKVDLSEELQMAIRDSAAAILDDAKRHIAGSGVAAAFQLAVDERPDDAIVRISREGRFDLVVLGRRGTHAGTVKQVGGVSQAVLAGAGCSVLLVI